VVEGSGSFLRKMEKDFIAWGALAAEPPSHRKGFLLLFCKKEALA
jgi:hypothetical protein